MMEEVYVIKLKGVPSTTTSESTTSTTIEANDVVRISALGLGVLHIIFGLLILTFGVLKTAADQEPSATVFGTFFGPMFCATGISALVCWKRPFRKLKMKVLFVLSLFSAFGSTAFLSLCILGVVYFHSVPRVFGDSAHVTANAIIATVGELIVSMISVFTAGSAVWQCLQVGVFRPSAQALKQKVIVKTNITGNNPGGMLDEEVIRHVSPNCVISLRATDEQQEIVRRVQQYVRDLNSQEDMSFTFSEPSTAAEEQDLGVDSQNWRNEVLSMRINPSQQNVVLDPQGHQ